MKCMNCQYEIQPGSKLDLGCPACSQQPVRFYLDEPLVKVATGEVIAAAGEITDLDMARRVSAAEMSNQIERLKGKVREGDPEGLFGLIVTHNHFADYDGAGAATKVKEILDDLRGSQEETEAYEGRNTAEELPIVTIETHTLQYRLVRFIHTDGEPSCFTILAVQLDGKDVPLTDESFVDDTQEYVLDWNFEGDQYFGLACHGC